MWMTLISPSIRRLLLLYATTQRTPGMLQLAMALVLPRNCYVCRECLKVSLSRVTYRLSFCDGVRTDPWDPQVWTTGIPDVLSIFPLPCIAVVVHQEKWGKMGGVERQKWKKRREDDYFSQCFLLMDGLTNPSFNLFSCRLQHLSSCHYHLTNGMRLSCDISAKWHLEMREDEQKITKGKILKDIRHLWSSNQAKHMFYKKRLETWELYHFLTTKKHECNIWPSWQRVLNILEHDSNLGIEIEFKHDWCVTELRMMQIQDRSNSISK